MILYAVGDTSRSQSEANRLAELSSLRSVPKGNKKMRLLGIPTAIDRMLQQAVLRVVMPQYEIEFSEDSHGFIHNIIV